MPDSDDVWVSADQIHEDMTRVMNEKHPFFVTHFLNMGRPVAVADTSFAYVKWDQDDGELTFCINNDNVKNLTDDEKMFIAMHETLHVFLRHDKLNFPNKMKSNIAADVVINDYLVDHGVDLTIPGLMTGPSLLGYSCSDMTVGEVYRLLPDSDDAPQACGFSEDHGEGGHGEGDEDGNGGSGLPDDLDVGDAPEGLNVDNTVSSPGYSPHGSTDSMTEWVDKTGTTLAWAELLKEVAPTMFSPGGKSRGISSFTRPHRKVAYAAPGIILPVARRSRMDGDDEEGKRPIVAIAIDVSGSIPQDMKNTFVTLVNSIPDEIMDGVFFTFDTQTHAYKKGSPHIPGGGGTEFSCIEEHVMRVVDSYPDAVVVLTDGDARFTRGYPPTEHYSKWVWLISDGGGYYGGGSNRLRVNKGESRVKKLKEFMRK